ncbi:MAG: hypothetical protein GY805_18945 [Chloroflexi bacterium]|nr:hypothetical protein [Chloroflexota bacterium]
MNNNSQILQNHAANSGGGIQNRYTQVGQPVVNVTDSMILSNTAGVSGGAISHVDGTVTITNSCIVFNSDTAVDGSPTATGNWWGVPDGPSGAGPGSGDSVGASVNYAGFLTSIPAGCPSYPAHLTLINQIVNDNNGTAVVTDWTLSASGPTPISGAGGVASDVIGGAYALSQSGGPAHYTASSWNCVGGSQSGNQVTVTGGQSAVCTITNDDDAVALFCDLIANTPIDFAGLSLTVTNLGSNLDCVRIHHFASNHPNATLGIQTGQYWDIDGLQADQSAPATTDFVFNITLPHSVAPNTNAKVCKYPGGLGGSGWDCSRSSSDASTVTRNVITTGFSSWAVGDQVGPTAILLNSFSATVQQTGILATILGGITAVVFGFWLRLKRGQC